MKKLLGVMVVLLTAITVQVSAQTVKDISPTEAKSIIDKAGTTVLDVRTQAEWDQGRLKGATRIDVMDKQFKQKAAKLDKNKPIVVYCAVGGRSAYAADDLVKLGFKTVYNMTGGINEWVKKGYPTQK